MRKKNKKIEKEKIVWVYTKIKDKNFWFIDVEWLEKWYFVHRKNSFKAISWDIVEAVLKDFRWKKEAVITKILKSQEKIFVWSIDFIKDFAFVIPDDKTIWYDVFISKNRLNSFLKNQRLNKNDKVIAKIVSFNKKNPEWIILKKLDYENQIEFEVDKILIDSQIRLDFPKKVIEEVNSLETKKNKKRINLKNKFFITIDWEDARDLDDAICVEKTDFWYKLIVAIADVSEYVKKWSFLDKEAYKRWNSVYIVNKVIPMLPEKLSNDLCSLNPKTDKLTLNIEIHFDKKWKIIRKKVFEWIINTKFRLTYEDVSNIIDGKLKIKDKLHFWDEISKELLENIKNIRELKDIIINYKKDFWVLEFDFPEIKIKIDDNLNPISIERYKRLESHKIIEEFMIIANQCIWEIFSNIPFLYRVHELPNPDDIENLRKKLYIFGLNIPYQDISSKTLRKLLDEIKIKKENKILSKMVLCSLSKAKYTNENKWHFGLWLAYYSHFTSPIRRYSDLIIHRIIKRKINNKLSRTDIIYYKNILNDVWKHLTETEIKREKIEYQVRDFFICNYYKDKIWQVFDVIITDIIDYWMFVEIDNGAEWMVLFDNFMKKNKLKSVKISQNNLKRFFENKVEFVVWQQIKVKLENINFDIRRMYFEVLL